MHINGDVRRNMGKLKDHLIEMLSDPSPPDLPEIDGEPWNAWRQNFPDQTIDLSGANFRHASLERAELSHVIFRGADLSGADLRRSHLAHADFSGAKLVGANLDDASAAWGRFTKADLSSAKFASANLFEADFSRAVLRNADFNGASMYKTTLRNADLRGANLSFARLIKVDLRGSKLAGAKIYGISAWDMNLQGADQTDLVIDAFDERPVITVDDLEVAQFIHLLLSNRKLRGVINSLTTKVVLILGRFTKERKLVLDAMREALRQRNFLPVLFDFDRVSSRNLTETVQTLAHLARFIIADITDPKSIPQELAHIIPKLPSVPVQPLLHARAKEYGMFDDFLDFHWVLTPYRYASLKSLLAALDDKVIAPAAAKAKAIEQARRDRQSQVVVSKRKK